MTSVLTAGVPDRATIRALLALCGLPDDDIDGDGVEFLVALDGKKVVGTIGLESYPPLGLLRSAAVDPAYRGQGIGSRLVADLSARARRRGLTGLVLLTTTAEKFFRDAGFRKVPRGSLDGPIAGSGQFTGTRCSSAVVMRLDLAGSPGDEGPLRAGPLS
jgi:amino-acid N-acetyltransferase